MADEDTPADEGAAEQPAEGHAVPSEDAAEIAGATEDAALEARQEADEAGAGAPAPPVAEPAGEGHAVPTEEAQEIAAAAEDAPLEAVQEAEDAAAVEAAVEEDEPEEERTPREKPAVPGAHLEVDIVPEGVDPLGREEAYQDPYAVEEETEPAAEIAEEPEEPLAEPIATAAIDLASGARYRATGKRKTAIARVILRPGSGSYLVNGRTLEEHFPRLTLQRNIRQPLETVGYEDRMDVVARLHGGGISAQAGALRHGVSRALLEADPNLRGELKRRGFLTRDSRAKERKKAGLKKARKRPQFSKR
jgi:small subunit ribosomal protein S9